MQRRPAGPSAIVHCTPIQCDLRRWIVRTTASLGRETGTAPKKPLLPCHAETAGQWPLWVPPRRKALRRPSNTSSLRGTASPGLRCQVLLGRCSRLWKSAAPGGGPCGPSVLSSQPYLLSRWGWFFDGEMTAESRRLHRTVGLVTDQYPDVEGRVRTVAYPEF